MRRGYNTCPSTNQGVHRVFTSHSRTHRRTERGCPLPLLDLNPAPRLSSSAVNRKGPGRVITSIICNPQCGLWHICVGAADLAQLAGARVHTVSRAVYSTALVGQISKAIRDAAGPGLGASPGTAERVHPNMYLAPRGCFIA
ncbi:hypothetical protein FKM82_005690 [Ascaphus truei]